MGLEIEAVYENGVLKLEREIPLENGQRVTLTIHPPGGRVKKNYGLLRIEGTRIELDQMAMDAEFGLEKSP